MIMENRIYFRLGGKFYKLTEPRASKGTWFEWVESARVHKENEPESRGSFVELQKARGGFRF